MIVLNCITHDCIICSKGMTGGLYARSLSLGLTNLLGPYLEKLSDIELQLLADPGLTLACLVSQLDEVCTCIVTIGKPYDHMLCRFH